MRDELMQHSGTVKPLTEREKEELKRRAKEKEEADRIAAQKMQQDGSLPIPSIQQRRGSGGSGAAGARPHRAPSPPPLLAAVDADLLEEAAEDYASFQRRGSAGPESSFTSKRSSNTSQTAAATGQETPLSPGSRSTLRSIPKLLRRSSLSSAALTLPRDSRPPSFFRLLLSDEELNAAHRGVNLLLAHPETRWLRSGGGSSSSSSSGEQGTPVIVHSVHLILLRPKSWYATVAAAGGAFVPLPDLNSLVPLPIGQKHALRRLAAERARAAQIERQQQQQQQQQQEFGGGTISMAGSPMVSQRDSQRQQLQQQQLQGSPMQRSSSIHRLELESSPPNYSRARSTATQQATRAPHTLQKRR